MSVVGLDNVLQGIPQKMLYMQTLVIKRQN